MRGRGKSCGTGAKSRLRNMSRSRQLIVWFCNDRKVEIDMY
jgi:hypothetical protein